MLAMPQMRPVARSPVPNQPNTFAVTYEGGSSPRELLEYIVIQARAAAKGLKATSAKEDDVVQADLTEEELRVSMDQHLKQVEEKRKVNIDGENAVLLSFWYVCWSLHVCT
jgi:hypothetical protein